MSGQVIMYMATFFIAMVCMELVLETATAEFGYLDALAAAVTLSQFGFCFIEAPMFISQHMIMIGLHLLWLGLAQM